MTLQIVFNGSDSILTTDEAGRTIGGHEWGVVDDAEERTAALLRDLRLTPVAYRPGQTNVSPEFLRVWAEYERRSAEQPDTQTASRDGQPDSPEVVEAVGDKDVPASQSRAGRNKTSRRASGQSKED